MEEEKEMKKKEERRKKSYLVHRLNSSSQPSFCLRPENWDYRLPPLYPTHEGSSFIASVKSNLFDFDTTDSRV